MSLPPALLQRLAQRGLVQKKKSKESATSTVVPENEEVIAEDYDEMDADDRHEDPSMYEDNEVMQKRPAEDSFWVERMRARMGNVGSSVGYKGCPNKYNIWHKCTLYCVTRWADGYTEPNRDYLRRYRRLIRKYPLPKGWTEMYDPGCGCFYFCNASDHLVSWLPPTHPKSQVSKSAAVYRRQLDEVADGGSDGEQKSPNDEDTLAESTEARHHREIDAIINASMRPNSPPSVLTTSSSVLDVAQDYVPSLQDAKSGTQRKQKSRDLERALKSRQRREKERNERNTRKGNNISRRLNDMDAVDPMDPSAYSDIPRGKWSDGLEDRKKSTNAEDNVKERKKTDKRLAVAQFSDEDPEEEADIHDY